MSEGGNADPNAMMGMKVDFEMKLLAILVVFSVVKLLNPLTASPVFVNVFRGIFLFGHILMVYTYVDTASRISKSSSRTAEEKAAAKTACFGILKGILFKAVLFFLLHLRSGMLPPLVVTIFMGFCSLIENDYYYQVLYSKVPQLFEFMYR